jgi:hypothetical protein
MNRIYKAILLIFLTAICLNSTGLHVPVNDPVYDFLDRMATRGIIRELLNDTRPLRRDKVAEYLVKLKDREEALSYTDRLVLKEYLLEYRSEFGQCRHPKLTEGRNHYTPLSSRENFTTEIKKIFEKYSEEEPPHLFIYEKDKNLIWLDVDGRARLESKNGIFRLLGAGGMRLSSQLGDKLSLYMDARGYLWNVPDGFTDFPEEVRNTYVQDEPELGAQYFDKTEAYFQYRDAAAGTFSVNHESIIWGNSPNSMILSDNIAPFGFIQWQKDFDNAKYTFVHGSLLGINPDIDAETNIKSFPLKYFVGHRLETAFLPSFHFAFTEMIIYGNRNYEFDYIIPLSLLFNMEHEQRDRDNNLMAFEFEWLPSPGFKMYGSLLLDELKVTEIGKRWWANKQGWQAGIHISPRIPTEFIVEWTGVRPWTYTHKVAVNTYTHNGECLGFYAGPNSQLWLVENRWWLGRRLYGKIQYRRLKHGVDPLPSSDPGYYPVGGDANQDYSQRNPDYDDKTKWLMGDIKTTNEYGIFLTYRWRKEIFFDCGGQLREIDGRVDKFLSFQIRFDY